jgi:lipoic acid synthetase
MDERTTFRILNNERSSASAAASFAPRNAGAVSPADLNATGAARCADAARMDVGAASGDAGCGAGASPATDVSRAARGGFVPAQDPISAAHTPHIHGPGCAEHTTSPERRSGPNNAQLHLAELAGAPHAGRLPPWMKVRLSNGAGYSRIRQLVAERNLHTVCQSADCPNMSDCWSRGTATFMILGNVCTRSCGFCAVQTGRPLALDPGEPRRVGEAVMLMGLRHAVVTSVNRDELADGGARHFAATIRAIRASTAGACLVEVLIPDFRGDHDALAVVLDAQPDVLNHNVETVPRLYPMVRPQARFERSLALLQMSKRLRPDIPTKSGFMVGLGEEDAEVEDLLRSLRAHEVDIVTIGQYLRPTPHHLPVVRYVHPDRFDELAAIGLRMGFKDVASGPLVRSSYHAEQTLERATSRAHGI